MIDTWSTVGSCAQIGKRVHISGGVGIGGVLEPLQAEPVIVEDDCFIGARSEVAEGVIVRKGAVLAMGVFLGASTKIVDRDTGEVFIGEVPEYSVVVPGALPGKPLKNGQPGPSTACAVIVKRVDERTRSKTSINELLRIKDGASFPLKGGGLGRGSISRFDLRSKRPPLFKGRLEPRTPPSDQSPDRHGPGRPCARRTRTSAETRWLRRASGDFGAVFRVTAALPALKKICRIEPARASLGQIISLTGAVHAIQSRSPLFFGVGRRLRRRSQPGHRQSHGRRRHGAA